VLCCFVGVVPVSTALIGIAVGPYALHLAEALLLIRLIPWIVRQPFAPSYWASTFGLPALAISFLRFVERGAIGPIPWSPPMCSSP
jgi:tellurite resistance protein TehA-like permease